RTRYRRSRLPGVGVQPVRRPHRGRRRPATVHVPPALCPALTDLATRPPDRCAEELGRRGVDVLLVARAGCAHPAAATNVWSADQGMLRRLRSGSVRVWGQLFVAKERPYAARACRSCPIALGPTPCSRPMSASLTWVSCSRLVYPAAAARARCAGLESP